MNRRTRKEQKAYETYPSTIRPYLINMLGGLAADSSVEMRGLLVIGQTIKALDAWYRTGFRGAQTFRGTFGNRLTDDPYKLSGVRGLPVYRARGNPGEREPDATGKVTMQLYLYTDGTFLEESTWPGTGEGRTTLDKTRPIELTAMPDDVLTEVMRNLEHVQFNGTSPIESHAGGNRQQQT
jgi:hypothetical protein